MKPTSTTTAAADLTIYCRRCTDSCHGINEEGYDFKVGTEKECQFWAHKELREAQQTDTLSRKEWWGIHLQCVRCGEDVVKLYTGEGVKNWVALCVPCWGKVQNKILASMPKLDSAKAEGKE